MIALYSGKYTEADLHFLEIILTFSIDSVKTSCSCNPNNCTTCEVIEACRDLHRLQTYVHNSIIKIRKNKKKIVLTKSHNSIIIIL